MKYRTIITTCLLCTMTLCFAQEKRGMTPLDVAKMEAVADARLSADGQKVAYTVRVQADPYEENKPAWHQLHLYDLSSGTTTALVSDGNVRLVRWRPGTQTITYLDRLEGDNTTTLYSISAGGGGAPERLYAFETSISNYAWSPDGQTLAFIAPMPKEEVKSDLPYVPEFYEQNLTYNRAYFVDPGNGDAEELMLEGHFLRLAWNPAGDKLLYAVTPTPLVDDELMRQQLYIVDATHRSLTGHVAHDAKLGGFAWSPDGAHIAFIAGADLHDPIDGRLFVVPAQGGTPQKLYRGWQGKFEQLYWTEPGQVYVLASQSTESVHGRLTVLPARDTPPLLHIQEGLAITHIETNANGDRIAIASSWDHPSELFVFRDGGWQRLTNSNPWFDELAFGRQEVVRYKARDGLEIHGMVIRPVGEEAGRTYPMITVVHGGPEAHYLNGWLTAYSLPGQVAAARGYAVFYPNYRGSTGRGLEFILTSQGDAAGAEFDDIVDGVDHLVSTGLVDKDRVGVTGGSYGGYATAWLSTRYTERFAAGVMFVGITNKVSKWGTTDIPNEEYLVHARKWVYDAYDFFLQRSPIFYAGQCKTPLLIVHGKEDTRVHPGQSMEIYRHIKSRTDTPVELIVYPGEGHGNARATARYDYNLRMLDWFDKYLVRGGRGRS